MIGKDRGNCQAKLVPQTLPMREATAALQKKYSSEFWARRREYTAQPRRNTNQVSHISGLRILRQGKVVR